MAKSDAGYERLGAKVLSLPDVIAQSVGFMGPVFSSAFVIPLVVGVISASGKGGGVASPLSVIIAGIGVFALGWIVSSYAREVHAAGSLYDYVTRGLGNRVGTAAGWLYYGGVTVLLVEQDVSQARRVASHLHCLLEGRTTLEGRPAEFTSEQVEAAYFGYGQASEGNEALWSGSTTSSRAS